MSALFRTISFLFEVIHGEYLSRTQRLRKGRPSCPFCTQHKLAPWPKTYDIYLYTADLHICFFYADVCSHVLVLHWANLVLVPSGMVHINH